MDNLTDSLSIISVVFGILSILITVFSSLKNVIAQRSQLKELEKLKFEAMVESSDILQIGGYLDKEIGKLTISDYVDNEELTKKVDSLINNLTRFVGTDKEMEAERIEQEEILKSEPKHNIPKDIPFTGKLGEEFDKIINELYTGEEWNALARLRRHLEMLLKDISQKHGIKSDRVYSLTKQIEILRKDGVIDQDIASNLRYPIHVSNRAIHGEDLKPGEAEEALFHAAYSIDKLINKSA